MDRPIEQPKKIVEYVLPGLILAFLLIYSCIKIFQYHYGFGWDPNSEVYVVFTPEPPPTIEVGDRLVRIGSLSWDVYAADLRKTFFEGLKPGATVPVLVQRNGITMLVTWTLPGINQGEVLDQIFSEWLLVFVFWVVGTIIVLFLRPKDQRWWLLVAFNYLTAIWLCAGSGLSNYHILSSAIILRMAIWLSIPVYLHLHWVFPRPLGKLSPIIIGLAYLAAGVLMTAQWFQLVPQNLYFLGFLLAVLGSVVLLVFHAVRQTDTRQELKIIWIAILFAVIPLLATALIGFINGSARADSLALLSFPALPLSYLYSAYRRQLGGLEVRVNRLITVYLFLILLATISMPIIAGVDQILSAPADTFILATIATLAVALTSINGFPAFQSFVERRWLGISLPSKQLPLMYSQRATASTSIATLLDLLQRDFLPSLLVREFMFLWLEGSSSQVLLKVGLSEDKISAAVSFLTTTAQEEKASSPLVNENVQTVSWIRLELPLRVGEKNLGYWLFGRRDPDDHYPENEISILQSLADQTAITLSNIIQTERLRTVYQTDINRFEQERLRLALELHDGILNRIAVLLMKLDDTCLTPAFQDAYNELIKHLREIVRGLRPASLNFGLKPAFDELADDLRDRSENPVLVTVNLETDGSRYPQNIEQHLFRIVQEACSNALTHGNPSEILISGRFNTDLIELSILDNGSGFDINEKMDRSAFQDNSHYGLAGMYERSELIGATLKIDSSPRKGTRVSLTLTPNK